MTGLLDPDAAARGAIPAPRGSDEDAARDAVDASLADWRRESPDIDTASLGIVARLQRVARYLERARTDQLAERATDRGSMDVLAMLRRAGAPYRRSAGALTRSALITAGGVSQRLDKLERAGLVTRHVDDRDRRRVDVQLSPRGAELVDSVLTDLVRHDTCILATALDDHEQETLRRLLRKLLRALESPDVEA